MTPTTPRALMLFAAGFGTRMAPLTRTRPKPLIPVAGRALIDHALDQATGMGLARIVANTHHLAEQVEAHLAPRGVRTVRETPDILDTGGGLRNALDLLEAGEPEASVFTLNTDAVWTGPSPLRTLADAWDPQRMDALLMLVAPERAVGRSGPGDFARDAQGRLSRGGPFTYAGAQIIRAEAVRAVPERVFSLNRVWDALAARGRLFGVVHPGAWCEVGHPGAIAPAEALLRGVADG